MAKRNPTPKKTEVEEVAEAPKAEATPAKKKAKIQYWQHRVFINGVGTVQGEAEAAHIEAFKAKIPKETNLDNWLGDSDPIAKAREERRKISKAKRDGTVSE